jgi:hypothetical protein
VKLSVAAIERLEQLARQRSSRGVSEIRPSILFHMLDGALAVNESADIRTLSDALTSWSTRARDIYNAALAQRLRECMFDRQNEICSLIEAGERRIALCCGRRAGKTKLLGNLLIKHLSRALAGQEVVFAAPTVVRAKELIWDELMLALMRHGLCDTWHASRAAGTVRTPHGGILRLAGLDTDAAVERFSRGGNCVAFFVDEAGVCWKMLKRLLKAAGPSLVQTRGALILSGTPDQVESGDWWEICQGFGGFAARNWSLLDNPFLGRDPVEVLAEERATNGWDEAHPEYVTEYLGRWCTNPSMLVFDLNRARNLCDQPIQYDLRTWRHFIGIDYGFFPDPCAWVVLAAPPDRHDVYCIHSETADKLDSDQIAKKTLELATRYRPIAIVGDSASGGPVFMADYNRKYGHGRANIQSADKYDKPAGITLINTELRLGRFKFVASTERLYDQCAALRWADDRRQTVLEGPQYPEDEPDAFRYAFLRALMLFTSERKSHESRHEEGIRLANERGLAAQRYDRWTRRSA